MNKELARIRELIAPLREQIIAHPVYKSIKTIEDLRVFMTFHVYAVWDFMSLLKSLQHNLTCVTVPWFPVGDAQTRHLINEIVAGEEADLDLHGQYRSHFELYLAAMEQSGANAEQLALFLAEVKKGSLHTAFKVAGTPTEAANFVRFTFDVINTGKLHLQAAVFTFGREDLIPGMFMSIINDLDKQFPSELSIFKYYLQRHIDIDGDHHSHLALRMTANLCGDDPGKWQEAEDIIIQSLQQRITLWNGVQRVLE